MPEKATLQRAKDDEREGKSPSTQAGEFVREEMDHVREGKHGVASTKQAVAIGLSKARRAGVKLPPPKGSATIRKKARQDIKAGLAKTHPVSAERSKATLAALKREPRSGASHEAISRQAKQSAARRSKARRTPAKKAARTRRAA